MYVLLVAVLYVLFSLPLDKHAFHYHRLIIVLKMTFQPGDHDASYNWFKYSTAHLGDILLDLDDFFNWENRFYSSPFQVCRIPPSDRI